MKEGKRKSNDKKPAIHKQKMIKSSSIQNLKAIKEEIIEDTDNDFF